jgi:hypothetical protein
MSTVGLNHKLRAMDEALGTAKSRVCQCIWRPRPGRRNRPVATPYALTAYAPKNQERILAQCPHATHVRGFHAWLKPGRVVRKGSKGIKIIAPVMGTSDGTPKVVNIKPAYVFDVTQTDELAHRAAA